MIYLFVFLANNDEVLSGTIDTWESFDEEMYGPTRFLAWNYRAIIKDKITGGNVHKVLMFNGHNVLESDHHNILMSSSPLSIVIMCTCLSVHNVCLVSVHNVPMR